MSKSLTASPLQRAINDQTDDLWVEQVAPALADLEDAFTDHGLVRELGRRSRTDARALVIGGSGLLIGLQEVGHLSAAVSAVVTAAGLTAGTFGPAINDRNDTASKISQGEMYYLYRLSQTSNG